VKDVLIFRFAHFIGKLIQGVMSLLGWEGSYFPGVIVSRLDPNYLAHVDKPKKLVIITGTNGKTTVSNMISAFLDNANKTYINNGYGSNTREGIISTFLSYGTWSGKIREEFGIIELDERSAIRVFPMLHPSYILVTNLFRDSYARNAHAYFIFDILNNSIPNGVKMLLNTEDPLSNQLSPQNEHIYYGFNLQDWEEEDRSSRINDLVNCPNCHHKLEPVFIRYNHIGRYYCKHCSYKSPEPKYSVINSNISDKTALISNGEEEALFKLATTNVVDVYNTLSAVAILQELGITLQSLAQYSNTIEVPDTRFDYYKIKNKDLFIILAKRGNPIASSRSIDFIRRQKGKKAVVLLNSLRILHNKNVENTAWIYDNNFSYLDDPEIVQIICCGKRYLDFALCLRMAGVAEEKISLCENYDDIADTIQYDKVDLIGVLRSITPQKPTLKIIDSIREKMEGE